MVGVTMFLNFSKVLKSELNKTRLDFISDSHPFSNFHLITNAEVFALEVISVSVAEWEKLRQLGRDRQKCRLDPSACKQNPGQKVIYVDCITARRVRFDDVKTKYVPIEEKQSIVLMSNLEFEKVKEKIWEYYTDEQGLEKANYDLDIITGLFGPKVFNTIQLGGKKDLLVLFTPKTRSYFRSVSAGNKETSLDAANNLNLVEAQTSTLLRPIVRKSIIPRLTVSDVMAMGKNVENQLIFETAKLQRFIKDESEEKWAWSQAREIKICKGIEIGSGGFRIAYRCIVEDAELLPKKCVLKFFNEEAITARQDNYKVLGKDLTRNETVADLNRKAVQSQAVAQLLGRDFQIELGNKKDLFGEFPSYLVELRNGVFGTVEKQLDGQFVKYYNNSMDEERADISSDEGKKISALAHFSFNHSNGEYLITDIQGVGLMLTDPEIASKSAYVNDDMLFGAGNMSEMSLNSFAKTHKCNIYCQAAKLSAL